MIVRERCLFKMQTVNERLRELQTARDYNSRFIYGYLECALWASPCDDNNNELDSEYSLEDLTSDALTEIVTECNEWITANRALLDEALDELPDREASQHGHDLFLTRNRHGAGFWDRGYSSELSEKLTNVSHDAGSRFLWGDNETLSYMRG